MFINFWYPAEESANLGEEPLKIQMLGLKFVLWRDADGKAKYLADTQAIIDGMDKELGGLFLTRPKAELIVKAVEPFREKAAGKGSKKLRVVTQHALSSLFLLELASKAKEPPRCRDGFRATTV